MAWACWTYPLSHHPFKAVIWHVSSYRDQFREFGEKQLHFIRRVAESDWAELGGRLWRGGIVAAIGGIAAGTPAAAATCAAPPSSSPSSRHHQRTHQHLQGPHAHTPGTHTRHHPADPRAHHSLQPPPHTAHCQRARGSRPRMEACQWLPKSPWATRLRAILGKLKQPFVLQLSRLSVHDT
jgi:hypothetical protein